MLSCEGVYNRDPPPSHYREDPQTYFDLNSLAAACPAHSAAARHSPSYFLPSHFPPLAVVPEQPSPQVPAEEDREAVEAGCVLWTDDAGTRWCLDAHGAYGEAGAISRLVDEHWQPVPRTLDSDADAQADGCIYWTDADGVRWCRDVEGVWGPAGGQYHSADGSTWFGDGDAWVTLSDEAADYFAAAGAGRRRAAAAGPSRGRSGDFPLAVAEEEAWRAEEAAAAAAARLYGPFAAAVAALEAAADAAFDERCRSARPALWPELPLRL